MTDATQRSITCASCKTVNEHGEVFCRECGTPVAASAKPLNFVPAVDNIEPKEPKALQRRPRLVVVIGLWVLFLPTLIWNLILASDIVTNFRSRENLAMFWLAGALVCLSLFVLFRITRNYITLPATREGFED